VYGEGRASYLYQSFEYLPVKSDVRERFEYVMKDAHRYCRKCSRSGRSRFRRRTVHIELWKAISVRTKDRESKTRPRTSPSEPVPTSWGALSWAKW
jgi:hypothetical protein